MTELGDFTVVRDASQNLSEVVLTKKNRRQVERIIEEWRRADELKQRGLRPMSKVLFCGPSGCGKTICAGAVAAELKVPLIVVRLDRVLASPAAASLASIFEDARVRDGVFLIEEIDAVAASRSERGEQGAFRHAAVALFQMLDRHEGKGPLIATTNRQTALDRALWRRFDEVVLFEPAGPPEIRSLLSLNLRGYEFAAVDLDKLAQKLRGLTHAEIERICEQAKKSAILQNTGDVTRDLLGEGIVSNRERRKLRDAGKGGAGRPRGA